MNSETSSSCSPQGSSSQPTTPSLWRKYISHDAPVQGAGSSSRFRVVRLAVGGAGSSGREPINIRLLDRKQPMRAECLDYMPPAPSPRPQNAPPPLRLDVDEAGRTVPLSAWLPPSWVIPSCSDSCSLQFGPNHLQPARGRQDLVKSHLMLAVREEVELLREQIRELQEKNQQLERENHILRTLTHNKHTT
ncbi:hypothetical protein INR49_008240 [Caranx melampygus]|nr:hypothetical protein INR49_008240 [Caranx melampygus]